MNELASRLLAARAVGDHFPEWLVGSIDLDQALDLQLAVLEDRRSAGADLGGWKVGLTSEASRKMLGSDTRPFGFVLADRVLTSGNTVDAAAISGLRVEAEMCFTIGADVDNPAIRPDRILDHVESVSAGFELNETRAGSNRPDFPAMVTDCLTNWGIVVGPPAATARSADQLSATEITMARNGETVFTGISSDHVDDHAVSLCALVDTLARHGQVLRAGQRVITGAFARFDAEPGDRWSATFSNIGTVEINIT